MNNGVIEMRNFTAASSGRNYKPKLRLLKKSSERNGFIISEKSFQTMSHSTSAYLERIAQEQEYSRMIAQSRSIK